jgi:hypothetical protein
MSPALALLAFVVAADVAPTTPADPAAAPPAFSSASSPSTSAAASSPSPSGRALPAADARATGLDTLPTAAVQIGAGLGGCCAGTCLGTPFLFIPVVGPVLGNAVAGMVIGFTEVVVGDAIGQKRGALLLPVAASTGALAVGAVIQLIVNVAFGITPTTSFDPANPGTLPPAASAAVGVSAAISLVSLTTALVVPAVLYQFNAVDKKSGDPGGFGMPGLIEPADPTLARGPTSPTTAPAPAPSATTPATTGDAQAPSSTPPALPY